MVRKTQNRDDGRAAFAPGGYDADG